MNAPILATGREWAGLPDQAYQHTPGQGPPRPGLRLHVVVPALNEERTIAEVIRAIPREIPGVRDVEVVVVDDGSTDRTKEEARGAQARVVSHPAPRGVGAAFHTGLNDGIERGADLLVSIDADGQFDPRDIPSLVAPVITRQADFATASRFKDPLLTPSMPRLKLWGNKLMSRLISRLAGRRFFDVSCGFRCYSRRAVLNLHLLGGFTHTQEVFMNLAFKQLAIVEVPLRVRGVRKYGDSRVADSLLKYALRTSRIIFRCYRDYHPLRFFGAMALMLIVPAFLSGLFLLWHYLTTGGFSPHKWAGFAAGALLALGLMMLHMGMIGDMLARHRIYLEELLYHRRAEIHRRGD
ncbi:MAG: glycosyltransferase family 2 protein [Phycisphaerae bacterium]